MDSLAFNICVMIDGTEVMCQSISLVAKSPTTMFGIGNVKIFEEPPQIEMSLDVIVGENQEWSMFGIGEHMVEIRDRRDDKTITHRVLFHSSENRLDTQLHTVHILGNVLAPLDTKPEPKGDPLAHLRLNDLTEWDS